jgi:hypothetical protein
MNHADQRSPAKSAAPPQGRRNEHDVFYAGERLGIARRLTGMSQQRLGRPAGCQLPGRAEIRERPEPPVCRPGVAATQVPGVDLGFFAEDKGTQAEDAGKPTSFSAHEFDLIRFYRAPPTRRSAPVAPAGADDSAGCGVGWER